jgi:hypothetical protein
MLVFPREIFSAAASECCCLVPVLSSGRAVSCASIRARAALKDVPPFAQHYYLLSRIGSSSSLHATLL